MKNFIQEARRITLITYTKAYIDVSNEFADRVLKLPKIQNVIQSDSHFDLVIGELLIQDAFFAFGAKFNAPTIGLSPMKLVPMYNWLLCDPHPSSFVVSPLIRIPGKMTLFSRIINTVYNFILGRYLF